MPDVVPIAEQRAAPLTLALWTAGVINRWRTIAWTVLAAVLLAVAGALILPPVYTVTVSFAPNPSTSSKLSGALSGGLGPLAGLAGGLGIGGGEPSESPAFYTELLRSRELLTRLLLTRFRDPRNGARADSARLVDIMKLRSDNPRRRIELGIKALTKSMKLEANPATNLVKLTLNDRYPDLAAREANVALALVNTFNLEQRASRARGKREYLQERLAEAHGQLLAAQSRYRDFLSGNRQWSASPALMSEESSLRRDQEVATDLYLSLEKEFESARLDEFNDAALITVVDSAVAPVKPAWPRYSLLLPGALLLGFVFGVMIAGISTVYSDWRRREPAAARALTAAIRRGRGRPGVGPVARRA